MGSSLNLDNKETDRYYTNDNAACGEIKKNLINNSKTIHVICLHVKKNMSINNNIYKEIKYFDIINNSLVYRKSTFTIRNKNANSSYKDKDKDNDKDMDFRVK